MAKKQQCDKYKTPPKRVFRAMGLGVVNGDRVKVIAGFSFKWWDPCASVEPIIVEARILRSHATVAKLEGRRNG